MNLRLPNRSQWKKLLPVVLLVAALVSALGWAGWRHFATTPTLTGVAQQMRETPERWLDAERDVSVLAADLAADRLAVVGMGDDVVLVSTRDGMHYFVADTAGARVANLALAAYSKDRPARFQAVALSGVKRQGGGALAALDVAGRVAGLAMLAVVMVMVTRMMKGGTAKDFSLTEKPAIRFADVIGASEAKNTVGDVVTYLKDPKAFAALGARPPKGVLLVGPPGTGKTRLAQAVAGECGVAFVAASGSDFTSKFYGMGPQRVKALFALARKHAPCIVFIDEIDGIGRRSSSGQGAAESESNRIINQMLIEMDGFAADSGVIVMGATNLPDMMDEAMLREGRFDRRVSVKLPDVAERADIFRLYVKGIRAAADLDFERMGRLTTGLSPAAIAYVVNNAALIAARRGLSEVGMPEFTEAIEVAHMGEASNGTPMTEAERERVAVHETGHALVAQRFGVGRLEKVTILPRGQALGVTLVTQQKDSILRLKSELEHRVLMLLAGRGAERLVYGEVSSGASHDLQEATKIVMAMVTQYGMGEQGSLVSLDALPRGVASSGMVDRAMAEVDATLRRLEARCLDVLQEMRPALDAITARLLAEETVSGEDVAEEMARCARKGACLELAA